MTLSGGDERVALSNPSLSAMNHAVHGSAFCPHRCPKRVGQEPRPPDIILHNLRPTYPLNPLTVLFMVSLVEPSAKQQNHHNFDGEKDSSHIYERSEL